LTLFYFYLAVSLGKPQEPTGTNKTCTTTSDSVDPGTKCVFPFIYEGVEHFGCPMDPENNRRWCSTETNENGEHVSGKDKYGFCSDTCPLSLNIDDFIVVDEALPDQQTTICDFTACNGLLMNFAESTGLKDTLGQCQSYNLNGEAYCFVNEDSSCPKLAYDGKPGSFISTQPCTDPRAPKPRKKRFVFTLGAIIGFTVATIPVAGAAAVPAAVPIALGTVAGATAAGFGIARAVKKNDIEEIFKW